MRLNSARAPSTLKEIMRRHRMKSASGDGLMGFKGRFSATAMEFQNSICHLGRRRLCTNGSAFLSAPASWRRNMEKKKSCACHRFSPRHLRFNCGDMNAIFVSAALKLNGRTAAIGEWVLGSVSSKLSASLIELPPLPVCSIHFQCKFNFTLFHLDNQLSISTAFWGNLDYKYLYMKANTLQRTTQGP